MNVSDLSIAHSVIFGTPSIKSSLRPVLIVLTPIGLIMDRLKVSNIDIIERRGWYRTNIVEIGKEQHILIVKVPQGRHLIQDIIRFLILSGFSGIRWLWFGFAGGLSTNFTIGQVSTAKVVCTNSNLYKPICTRPYADGISVRHCTVSRFLSMPSIELERLKSVGIDTIDLESYWFHKELLNAKPLTVSSINIVSDLPLTNPYYQVASKPTFLRRIEDRIDLCWNSIFDLL